MAAAVVLGLTVTGLVIRALLLDQALFGDEVWTYGIIAQNGFFDVVSAVYDTSITPPLHYLLAWLTAQVGDDTITVRGPSLLFGTATIPVVYLLGRRMFGELAGVVAAATVALSPFALFYSVEARAYTLMMFLLALSTLALLIALERGRARWWVVYAVCACAALYTHYTAGFVLLAQAGWALWVHRERLRTLLIVHAAIVLAYLPWVPGFLEQRKKDSAIEVIGVNSPLSVETGFDFYARMLTGHPYMELDEMPGWVALGLLAAGIAAGLVAWIVTARRRDRAAGRSPGRLYALAFLLALATPAGLVVYAALGSNLYIPRNLSASFPAVALLVGAMVASLPRRAAAVAAIVVAAGLVIGAVRSLDEQNQRPDYREVAEYLDERAAPNDPVIERTTIDVSDRLGFSSQLYLYVDREHTLVPTQDIGAVPDWRRALQGRQVFLIRPELGLLLGVPKLAGPDDRVLLREQRDFPGFFRLFVGRYSGEAEGRLVNNGGAEAIDWSRGKVSISPDAAKGVIDSVSAEDGEATVAGWAIDPRRVLPADWILVFSGSRLVSAGPPSQIRADVGKEYGYGSTVAGFTRTVPAKPDSLRVFAVVGSSATELPRPEVR